MAIRRVAFAAVANKATVALRLMKNLHDVEGLFCARNRIKIRPDMQDKLAIIDVISHAHQVEETRCRDFGGGLSIKGSTCINGDDISCSPIVN